jgi:cysteinyl-tRNA synthetase
VGLYTCGPTVHDFAHIGNFRAYVWEDLLRRWLEFRGFEVHHVMNITDVEDKTIRRSAETGVSLDEYTARYVEAFFEDLKTLAVRPAHEYPRATDHVKEMIEIIEALEKAGHTYISEGSVYFRIETFPGYGRLSNLERRETLAGARIDSDEYEKDDVRDFVLWKAPKDEGEPTWDSPWGPGRPGWHIECSAMSMRYLGRSFDLHTGGVDNIFPHHENEIAQSECATGEPFVRYWMHCAHLMVDGQKMSKSLGNFHTLRDLLERGHSPRTLRYLLLGTHYRRSLNFTFEAAAQAEGELARIDDLRRRLDEVDDEAPGGEALERRAQEALRGFTEGLDDDLNISGAMGELFTLVREANSALDAGTAGRRGRDAVLGVLDRLDDVLGVLSPPTEEDLDAEIEALITRRQEARARKDWAEADRIRDELDARGIVLEDTPRGVRWKRRASPVPKG